jgi:hypothetical protein
LIEYIYDAIKATAGEDIPIIMEVRNPEGELVTEGCGISIHCTEDQVCRVDGVYDADGQVWKFVIPGEATKGHTGRHYYCVCKADGTLNFKTPIYLV